jgi:hypothetical protein
MTENRELRQEAARLLEEAIKLDQAGSPDVDDATAT